MVMNYGKNQFNILKQWGRTLLMQEKLCNKTTSLIGFKRKYLSDSDNCPYFRSLTNRDLYEKCSLDAKRKLFYTRFSKNLKRMNITMECTSKTSWFRRVSHFLGVHRQKSKIISQSTGYFQFYFYKQDQAASYLYRHVLGRLSFINMWRHCFSCMPYTLLIDPPYYYRITHRYRFCK